MSREEILQLIFAPGLSTAETVSAISGRGVGLDVVRENIERIGGSVRVTSTPGAGTIFYLRIPLTLSIITGLTVEVGGLRFALPQSYVEEIVRLGGDRSEEHTSELQSLMRISYAVFCLKKKKIIKQEILRTHTQDNKQQ